MKRFLLFAGDEFYPIGGWADFVDDFDTFEEARNKVSITYWDWYQIIDTKYHKAALQFPKLINKENKITAEQ